MIGLVVYLIFILPTALKYIPFINQGGCYTLASELLSLFVNILVQQEQPPFLLKNASIMSLPALCHCQHYVIACIMSLPALCHCQHYVIACIMSLPAIFLDKSHNSYINTKYWNAYQATPPH